MFQKTQKREGLKLFFLFLLLAPFSGFSQDSIRNPYGLPITGTMKEYKASCLKDKNNELVDLGQVIPGILLDIRYATSNNFTQKPVYTMAKAYLRLPAASALAKAQELLKAYGYGLKVYDAYRPYAATLAFWEVVKDTLYVASPQKGSRHNRGCAVDVTVIDLATGAEVEMPTAYDDFTPKAGVDYIPKEMEPLKNRQMLIDAMQMNGFTVLPSEWWHYDFTGWQRFGLLDIPFEELAK
jgi:D-alanyl-D-alanine dipeptidase